MSYFEYLPKELLNKIVSPVDCDDIIALSIINKYLLTLCNENIWEQYIIKKKGLDFYNYFKLRLNGQTWKQVALKYLVKHKILPVKNEKTGTYSFIKIFPESTLGDISDYCGHSQVECVCNLNNNTYRCIFSSEFRDKLYIIPTRFGDNKYYMKDFISNSCQYNSLFTDIKGITYYPKRSPPRLLF